MKVLRNFRWNTNDANSIIPPYVLGSGLSRLKIGISEEFQCRGVHKRKAAMKVRERVELSVTAQA